MYVICPYLVKQFATKDNTSFSFSEKYCLVFISWKLEKQILLQVLITFASQILSFLSQRVNDIREMAQNRVYLNEFWIEEIFACCCFLFGMWQYTYFHSSLRLFFCRKSRRVAKMGVLGMGWWWIWPTPPPTFSSPSMPASTSSSTA